MRKALITGASRGLGRALAVDLAARGAFVIGTGRNRRELARTEMLCGGPERFAAVALDVRHFDEVRKLVAEFSDIDACIVNAGIAHQRPFDRVTAVDMREIFDVNVLGALATMQAAASVMKDRGRGRIVVVASDASYRGVPEMAAYTASKHALLGLARTLAMEIEGTGVHVTVVCPGPIRTEILGNVSAKGGGMSPEDVANLVVASMGLESLSAVELRFHRQVDG